MADTDTRHPDAARLWSILLQMEDEADEIIDLNDPEADEAMVAQYADATSVVLTAHARVKVALEALPGVDAEEIMGTLWMEGFVVGCQFGRASD